MCRENKKYKWHKNGDHDSYCSPPTLDPNKNRTCFIIWENSECWSALFFFSSFRFPLVLLFYHLHFHAPLPHMAAPHPPTGASQKNKLLLVREWTLLFYPVQCNFSVLGVYPLPNPVLKSLSLATVCGKEPLNSATLPDLSGIMGRKFHWLWSLLYQEKASRWCVKVRNSQITTEVIFLLRKPSLDP